VVIAILALVVALCGTGSSPPYYRVDTSGLVHLFGVLVRAGGGMMMTTLPPGVRPGSDLGLPVLTSSGTPGGVEIAADGEVTLLSGNAALVSFDGVFQAAGRAVSAAGAVAPVRRSSGARCADLLTLFQDAVTAMRWPSSWGWGPALGRSGVAKSL